MLNQTPARSARLEGAVASLSETAASLHMMDVLALPTIVLRNDQQDALGKGLAVTEYANEGKSADEIRGLWQWVWSRLTSLKPQAAQAAEQTAAWSANEQTELRAAG